MTEIKEAIELVEKAKAKFNDVEILNEILAILRKESAEKPENIHRYCEKCGKVFVSSIKNSEEFCPDCLREATNLLPQGWENEISETLEKHGKIYKLISSFDL